jgi:DNA-binding CsgD family transcriptional regulator
MYLPCIGRQATGIGRLFNQQISPMRGPMKITDLIENIYDAALEPARWNDVVVGINEFVGGRACGIFSKDSISKSGVTHYYCGADPHFIQLYSDSHSRFDPLDCLPPLGQVVSIPDLVAFDEYRHGRFYQEWLRPQGCVDAANVVLENSNPHCPVLLTVLAGKHMVNDDMRQRIAQIVPHAHRSLTINKMIEYKTSEAASLAHTLDGLSAGIFLVDAQCRIVHANVAGRGMLCADDFLRAAAGQLVVHDGQTNQDLRHMIANGGVDVAGRNNAFSLTAHDGARYVAHLLPLSAVARNGAEASLQDSLKPEFSLKPPSWKSVAAVFVRKAELDSQSGGELVARTFGLTPAELRVLLAIVDVGGVPETSKLLRVAETTVKTHLSRVFSKTGASRQADLVKLAASFGNPLTS